MRKIFAIIGALIGGGLGITVLGSASQAADTVRALGRLNVSISLGLAVA